MKIGKMNEVPKGPPRMTTLFTGPVTIQSLISESKAIGVINVNFGKGVRTKFHTHDGDQILIVSAGKGMVATECANYQIMR